MFSYVCRTSFQTLIKKLSTPPDTIPAGGESCLDDNKGLPFDDLHNIDSLINDLFSTDSRIRNQHKKDSLIDDLPILVEDISNKGILVVLQTGSSSSRDSVWSYGFV